MMLQIEAPDSRIKLAVLTALHWTTQQCMLYSHKGPAGGGGGHY